MIGTAIVHPSESTDIHRARRIQKISTGLGVTVFILSLALPAYIVITIVTKELTYTIVKQNVTKNDTQSISIAQPSYDQYSQLYSTYPEALNCSCSQLSISYHSFVQLQLQFHPICTSIFISPEWINLLLHTSQTLSSKDFRVTASHSFQALRTLCELSQQTIDNNLMQFLFDEYLSTSVLPPQLFHSVMMARLNRFRSLTTNSFLLSFSMIRETIQSNALFSGLQTNYQLYGQGDNIAILPTLYDGDCSCASARQCITQSSIYDDSSSTILFSIPGFYTGCYVIDSLLRSDLRCFYNQTCIDEIQSNILSSSPFAPSVLQSSASTIYQQNTTIENILNNLMIESWETKLSYKNYYEQCAPSYCTYPVQTAEAVELETVKLIENKTNVASTIGLVIGITGGTIAILHLLIPTSVKFMTGRN